MTSVPPLTQQAAGTTPGNRMTGRILLITETPGWLELDLALGDQVLQVRLPTTSRRRQSFQAGQMLQVMIRSTDVIVLPMTTPWPEEF
jgi:ABC-type molybdate transport system ATPase subunit